MNPSGHHRSYSDVPEGYGRVKLPPISNLIDGSGRPGISQPSQYQHTYKQHQYQTSPTQGRPPLTPPESLMWSPGSDTRNVYQPDHYLRYEQRPSQEPYLPISDYRRSSVPVPPVTGTEVRADLSHAVHRQMIDPIIPNIRATGKNLVREEMIHGKGPCYVYDDGTVCQKIINGDTVNPKWGTTKAGKPRKRLGQACNTCREKKIKCDPSFPKCTQCQKFGRECRFEAASSSSNRSPRPLSGGSPSGIPTLDDHLRMRRPSVALTEASSHSESGTISSRTGGPADAYLSPIANDSNIHLDMPGPAKKVKLNEMEPELRPALQLQTTTYDDLPGFELEIDPWIVNRKLTEAYLDLYFSHVNNSIFSLVPEPVFLKWVERTKEKPQVSKLVLYCMLAVGCSFSRNPEKHKHAHIFSSIALEGMKQAMGHFSVQLVQARLLFALHEFQHGRDDKAWDLCGAALRTALAMNLNTEDGIAHRLRITETIYGLGSADFAECMRRTFWTAYTMDNLGVACLYIHTPSTKVDCYLRLPCSRKAYGTGTYVSTPLFEGEMSPAKLVRPEDQANVGTLAYLVQISSICCDIRALAVRAHRKSTNPRDKQHHTTAREDLEHHLRQWNENYTAHINRKTGPRSPLREGHRYQIGGLHVMYHYACMQLHRNIPHMQLNRTLVCEHARLAYRHAQSTLAMAEQLANHKSKDMPDYYFAASNPLSGYAIHYAIDILSAAGINAKLLENQSSLMGYVMDGAQLLDTLADNWCSARIHKKQVLERVTSLTSSAQAGITEGKIGFCMEQPMAMSLDKEEDLVYGVDRLLYLKSFDWADRVMGPSDLSMISSKGKRTSYSVWKD